MSGHGMNKIKNYPAYYCTECEIVCHLYEQGLTCGCGNPWDTEVVFTDNYPEKWIKVYVYVYEQNEFIGDLANFIFTFGRYKGVPAKRVLVSDPKYILWCHNNQEWLEWFRLKPNDLKKVKQLVELV